MDIRDIARLSGYSLGTVSRVLNGHPNVSDKARMRVLKVVEEVGYEPNSNARFLKMQGRTAIAVFVKGARNLLFADILERIQALLSEADEQADVVYLDEDENEVLYAIHYQQVRHPKGMLFLGGDPAFFKTSFGRVSVPGVLVTNTAAGLAFKNLSSVSTNDVEAAREVVEYLFSRGHRRIGIVGGNRALSQVSGRRLHGAEEALRAHGIELDYERDYEPCHFSMEEGYDAMVRLIMRSPDLTAVFALGDAIALGAMRAVFDMGLSIPGDLSLVGFDGVNSSQFSIPRLTTIRQDTRLIATRSVETLLASFAGEAKPVREMVPFQLLKRESVRALSPEDRVGTAPVADGGDDASNAVAATVGVSAGRAPETAKAGRTRARASRVQVNERRGVI
ncbi:LacI family DNA-binding transcriptional regulator [Enorma massiliensis]|uniref:LacI family DNA-binding transcriptional regulator n=1 Tax=Enorma massiliensis TaxID=1472761 RepID=UPI0023F39760|nr:LacI family DNA-binding transcriptional regulator [Enorma massiliensis]